MKNLIMIIDDEVDFLDTLRRGLVTSGFTNVKTEGDPCKARDFFERGEFADVALIDINMPKLSGIQLLEFIKTCSPETECIMVSALNEARVAVDCLKKGAYDYLVKPVSRDDLILSVKRALERRKLLEIVDVMKKDSLPKLENQEAFKDITTNSPKMIRMLREVELHAVSDVPILITGESGTGKELLARATHLASPRERFPFTPLNMVSIPGNLFDAEFFGYIKGSFTGADRDRVGFLEHTHRGTLFLDEIGDLPLEFQGKLLRVLQDGEFIKLGTNKSQKVDIRFVAATNQDLEKMIDKGTFRKDLYYRLKGTWIHLPPLRERREDIPLLAERFLEEFRRAEETMEIHDDAMTVLLDFDYPGNIRELRSIIQSAVNLARGKLITVSCLPGYLQSRKVTLKTSGTIVPLEDIEKDHILKAYDATNKNKVQTARILGIGLNTLRRKLESYGVD
jgi:DNA-binding NtrC family response regulator